MPKDIDSQEEGSYRYFVRDVVKNLKGKVHAWQIENEVYGAPNKFWLGDKRNEFDNYIRLYKTAAEEIRKIDPDTPIITPGILVGKIDFSADGTPRPKSERERVVISTVTKNLKRLLSECGEYIDGVDIHLYCSIDSIPGQIQWLNNIMGETKCVRPLWATEIGPSPGMRGTIDRKKYSADQAEEICQRFKVVLDSGAICAIYYLYKDNLKGDRFAQYNGLVDANGKKKPAYIKLRSSLE